MLAAGLTVAFSPAIVFWAAEIPVLALYADGNEVAVKWWGGMPARCIAVALLLGFAAWVFAKLD